MNGDIFFLGGGEATPDQDIQFTTVHEQDRPAMAKHPVLRPRPIPRGTNGHIHVLQKTGSRPYGGARLQNRQHNFLRTVAGKVQND